MRAAINPNKFGRESRTVIVEMAEGISKEEKIIESVVKTLEKVAANAEISGYPDSLWLN